MSINIEKQNSLRNINTSTLNSSQDVNIRRDNDDSFDFENTKGVKENSNYQENISLDFLTSEQRPESVESEDNEHESDEDPIMMNERSQQQDPEFDMSYEEIQQRKAFALYNLNRYKKQGYVLSRSFGVGHSLDELETEMLRIEKERDLDNGLQNCKEALLVFTKAVETVNVNYGPEWIKLNGWTKFVQSEYKSHKYDDVFIKLWQRWSSKLPDSPEFTLVWLLGCSAFSFHLANIQATEYANSQNKTHHTELPSMKEPSNYEDLLSNLNGTDTESVTSEISLHSNLSERAKISISLPEPRQKKQRGRPKKNKEV